MFRSVGAVVIWYLWLVCAVLNLIDLAVQGHDHTAVVFAAVVVLATGAAYIAALRPRIIADDDAVTLRNPLRDIRVPWGVVRSIDLRDMVRVNYVAEPADGAPARERVLRSWAMQSTYRGRMRSRQRALAEAAEAASSSAGYASAPRPLRSRPLPPMPSADRAVARLNDLHEAAGRRGSATGRVAVTWSPAAVTALAIPAMALVAVILI